MPVPAWLLKRGGRPAAYCHREMLDAVHYLVDNGVRWMALPVDFLYWRAVDDFFRRWRPTREGFVGCVTGSPRCRPRCSAR
ncbi:transposase [Streptomyces collinus]